MPFRCTNMTVQIRKEDGELITVGVVEGLDMEFKYNASLEPYYGSRQKRHRVGGKIATFTLTRWFYTDEGQEDLLLDLFENEYIFTLGGILQDNNGEELIKIRIKKCRLYEWKPLTGTADDIIGEQAKGFGLDWEFEKLKLLVHVYSM